MTAPAATTTSHSMIRESSRAILTRGFIVPFSHFYRRPTALFRYRLDELPSVVLRAVYFPTDGIRPHLLSGIRLEQRQGLF